MTSASAKAAVCALCASAGKLKQSHLIPQFVYRGLGQPGGPTQPLLCGACEERFSRWESKVAREVFHPLVRGQIVRVKYGPWLLRFATSVCWRILENARRENQIPPDRAADVAACLQTWCDFLRARRPDVGAYHLHLVRESGGATHAISSDVRVEGPHAWVEARMGPLVLSGVIGDQSAPKSLGVRLHREGKLKPRELAMNTEDPSSAPRARPPR